MANENKQAAAQQKGNKNEKPKKRNRIKETFAELKRVTWPTFGQTMKQTGAVFVVTIFFLVLLLIMDQLLGLAHRQLVTDLGDTTEVLSYALGGIKAVGTRLFASAPAAPLLL
ncbi:MAG: preprotein translocase subunit SecE [Clostridiales bacterium]|nr:preprotein translocase subunit SecE [Clostridiales bacterium]